MKDNHIVKKLVELGFHDIRLKSMFGGIGLFTDGIFWGMIHSDKLHVKTCEHTQKLFDREGVTPLIFEKKNHLVNTKNYPIPSDWMKKPTMVTKLVSHAIEHAKATVEKRNHPEHQRLRDLPNIKVSTEKLLKSVDIHSCEELKRKGAIQAFIAIKSLYHNVEESLLLKLEGAILGKHWAALSSCTRERLINQAIRYQQALSLSPENRC